MEHADLISDAFTYVKSSFFRLSSLPVWLKLFLYLIVPIISGILVATIILQFAVKPILVNLFVTSSFGFTENSIGGILQYVAIILGLLCVFFVPLFQGYLYRVLRGGADAPDCNNRWGLFFSGWRVNLVLLYYAIPLVVIFLLYSIAFAFLKGAVGTYISSATFQVTTVLDVLTTFSYIAIEFVTFIFVALFAFVGLAHLARTGSLREAVNMSGVAVIIKRIGWYDYILSIVIMTIFFLMLSVIFIGFAGAFSYLPVSNTILTGLYLFLIIPLGTFFARYLSNVYDTAFIIPEDDDAEFDDF